MVQSSVSGDRAFLRMLDVEQKGSTKFADFENFAKTFARNIVMPSLAAWSAPVVC